MLSIDANAKNAIREGAVKVANEELEKLRNYGGSAIYIVSGNSTKTVPFRKSTFQYNLSKIVTPEGTSGKSFRINLNIAWSYKGINYSYNTETIVGR
ncbi:hypothetical protein MCHI_000753 [Candidatus Magnetoovum chiemensis]|nr:hypothetical protein MCHI_000753 [Candidatus Magnetoovum chiemensis]